MGGLFRLSKLNGIESEVACLERNTLQQFNFSPRHGANSIALKKVSVEYE